ADQPVALQTESAEILFPPGAGGLPTLKMAFIFRADFGSTRSSLNENTYALYYRDNNFPNRVGWKEVIATAGPDVKIVTSSVPQKDRSAQLSNYPTDLLNSPPLDVDASVSFIPDQTALVRPPFISADTQARQTEATRGGSTATQGSARASASDPNAAVPIPDATRSLTTPVSQPLLQPNRQGTPQNRFTQLMTAN